jgi:hypothetical protein
MRVGSRPSGADHTGCVRRALDPITVRAAPDAVIADLPQFRGDRASTARARSIRVRAVPNESRYNHYNFVRSSSVEYSRKPFSSNVLDR